MFWLLSMLASVGFAAGQIPQICLVQGGNTKTIWGVGFADGGVEVYAWDAPFDEGSAIAALQKTPYRPADLLPRTPPPDARKVPIIAVDPRGLVMAVEWYPHYDASGFYDALNGGHVCWVRNSSGFSQPYLVRSAQPWFVYPERAHPGERVRVFGRNIAVKLVALRSREDGKVIALRRFGSGRHPVYECWAILPDDLPAGEYDLFVHNGAGGEAGWGGPVHLTLEAKPKASKVILNVKEFGAKGNGVDDDTEALRRALVKAGEMKESIVVLPPGLYPISAPIWVPSGVTLQGAGARNSILIVLPTRPMRFDVPPEIANAMPSHLRARQQEGNRGVMLWLRDRSAVCDIGLIDGPNTLQAIFASHTDCRIERCYIRQNHGTEPAVMVEWGSYGFVLRDSEIESSTGGVFLVHGPHRQAYIGGNVIRNIVPGTANNLFIRSFVDSVIENNMLFDGDRNFVSQTSFSSAYHSAIIGNIWRNNIPRRHNSGENMYESGCAVWHGRVLRADRKTVWVEGKPFTPDELRKRHPQLSDLKPTFALILDGCGLGQYRRIISNTEDSFTVEPEWEIVPDSSTYIMVGMAYVETLWIDNTEEHTANWTGFWGSCFGNVIDGHVLRDGEGLYLWAWHHSIPSPLAFNDIIGSRAIGRGNIVLRGPLVFGNTIRFCEVIDFRYRPSMHIQPVWLQGMDPNQRAGIALEPAEQRMEGLPETAPLKDWNIIEGTHIYDGPIGIFIAPEAKFTILRHNKITVDKDKVVNKSATTIIQTNPDRSQIKPPFRLSWARYFLNERIGTYVEPVVADGKVFIATHNGSVYALDAETGQPLWRFRSHGAFLHSPAYSEGLLIAASTDGRLYALDSETGKLCWFIFLDQGGFSASPAIDEELVFIGSRTGKFVAVELKAGEIRWQREFGIPIRQTAAIANGRVFVTPEDLRVRCLDSKTGEILWTSKPLSGQTARDFRPVVVRVKDKTFVVVRTNPARNMANQIGRDRQMLCKNAGIADDWRAIEAWTRSDKAMGSPELWAREQETIARYLQENRDVQTFFVLDAETGQELPPMPVLWTGGCQGVGTPPAVLPDGRLLVLYRSAYGNWNLGVAPLVALGLLDLTAQRITPLFHAHGMQPPWNTFWGTADESQNFVVIGDIVVIVHQGTLSGFNLRTGELFRIWGERDSWGGFRNLPWARNEWHGPARSRIAVWGNRIYWQTGSRILCIVWGEDGRPAEDIGIDGTKVQTQMAPELLQPSREQLQRQLVSAVNEVLSTRWMPFCLEPGLAGRDFSFDDSGELFEALALAYPHLPGDLQKQVKAFLAHEWQMHPPFTKSAWYPLDEGEPREWAFVPKGLRTRWHIDPQPHPFGNLYAVWLYASRCDEWDRVRTSWEEIRHCFDEFSKIGWQLNLEQGDLFANRYLASFIAFQKLAERFGDDETAAKAKAMVEAMRKALAEWWRRSAERMGFPVFQNINEWDAFIRDGDALFFRIVPHKAKVALFHDLTPEVAAIVKKEASEALHKVWQAFEVLCPTWHLVGEERQVHYGENFVDPPDFSLNAFKALTWLLNAPASELLRRVDIPFCQADLSYVVKLALVLER
jgi:hypothetical protein